MDTEQLVKYINLELGKNINLSVNKLCDKLGLKRSTIKSKFQKGGYSFSAELRKYEKNSVPPIDDNKITEVIEPTEPIQIVDDKQMTRVTNFDDNSMTFNNQIKSNLIGLADNYDRIMNLLNNDNSMNGNISIELPIETVDNFRTTVRVNNVVWENFKSFCNEHKEFTQRDLLSMALLKYINNNR